MQTIVNMEDRQQQQDSSHGDEQEPLESNDKCENYDSPKDLSMKKKMKQIPPPLNLTSKQNDAVNMLKDFAVIATSPKSPLMQKNLPFRKRAHSFSGVNDAASTKVVLPTTPTTSSEGNNQQEAIPPSSTQSSETRQAQSPRVPEVIRPPVILHTHPMNLIDTSALLSPAPSSLGSSQEELSYSPHWTTSASPRTLPWPVPIWHCFLPGCRIRMDQIQSGTWQLVEELAVNPSAWYPDLLVPLQLDAHHIVRDELDGNSHKISLQFSYISMAPPRVSRPWEGGVLVECELYHPFYVPDKGWCAPCPEIAQQQYGFHFLSLERGDVCPAPSKLPLMSPDICDRFKRFSFPPEEPGSSNVFQSSNLMPPPHSPLVSPPEGLLSPPSSPTKKVLEAMRPKRPMNAFMLFAKRYRLDLIQKYPGKDNRAISVLLGEAWRSLPSVERDVYVQEARVMAQEQKRLHPDCWKRKRSHSTS